MNNIFASLNVKEKELLCGMAVLPLYSHTIPELCLIFQIEEKELPAFFDLVHDLSSKSLLLRDKASYSIRAEIAIEIIEQKLATSGLCYKLLDFYTKALENPKLDYDKNFKPVYEQVKSLLANISGNSLQLARLSYLLSKNFVKYKKYSEALEYNQLAVKISEGIDERHPVVALFFRDKAHIYKVLGDKEKALYYSLKDIEILEKHAGKYDDLLPDSYFSLSKTYEEREEYEKAAEFGLKAIEFEKKKKRKKSLNLSGLYHNLAYYYIKMNNTQNASLYINKAVESFRLNNKNENYYKLLIKDQKKFNSLLKFEEFILKNRGILLTISILLFLALIGFIVSLFLI